MLYASNLKKVREFRSSRGVNIGRDSTGPAPTHYCEMRDLERDEIEVSEGPQYRT